MSAHDQRAGWLSEYRTSEQFSVLLGPSGQFQDWCNRCLTGTDLVETEPAAVKAEAARRQTEHDQATCEANRGQPLGARQWSGGDGAAPSTDHGAT